MSEVKAVLTGISNHNRLVDLMTSAPPQPTSAASNGPPTVHTDNEINPNGTNSKRHPPRSSFLARLVRKLVPCIPAPGDHDIDLNPVVSPPSEPQNNPENSPENVPAEPVSSPAKDTPKPDSTPPAPPPLTIPPNTDADPVVVPPTPTNQLLPPSETEGMTSGAVVPPGSSGTINKRHSHHSTTPTNGVAVDAEESEGSSFTESEDIDDINNDDAEDEEDRLIMNGGVGIPIGPVCHLFFFYFYF